MASILDFTKFSFGTEQIRAVRELLFDEVVKSPEINQLYTVYPNIVYDKEVGFIGQGSLVGVPSQGCNPTPQGWTIGTRKITWQPKEWEILIEQCYKDLESTAAVYSLKTGVNVADFTDSDYINIVVEVLAQSVKDFIVRLVWFSDSTLEAYTEEKLPTAAASEQTGESIVGTVYAAVEATTEGAVKCATSAHVIVYLDATAATGAPVEGTSYYTKDTTNKQTITHGDLTAGTVADYFHILAAGFFKQMAAQIVIKSKQGITISENAGVSYAAQALNVNNVQGYLSNCYYKADVRLRGKGFFLVTQSVYDAYEQSLAGKDLESMYRNLVDGIKTLTFHGIPVIPMPKWDEIIAAYFDNGTKLLNPHRIVYTSKEILGFGIDDEKAFGDTEIWYSKDSRKVKVQMMGKADAKLVNPELFTLAI